MTHIKRYTILTLILLIFIAVPSVLAQDDNPPPVDEVTDDDVNAIAGDLFCPICENVPLDVCSTAACADWRSEIRDMLAEGRSTQEVMDYFSSRYGDRVLANPESSGFNLLLKILPPLALLIGLVVMARSVRITKPAPDSAQAKAKTPDNHYQGLDAEYVERLEHDLKEYSAG